MKTREVVIRVPALRLPRVNWRWIGAMALSGVAFMLLSLIAEGALRLFGGHAVFAGMICGFIWAKIADILDPSQS